MLQAAKTETTGPEQPSFGHRQTKLLQPVTSWLAAVRSKSSSEAKAPLTRAHSRNPCPRLDRAAIERFDECLCPDPFQSNPTYPLASRRGRFALGAPTADDKLLTVTTGNEPPPARLKDMLPSAERAKIEQGGPWDVNTAILRLDGNLTHGHSGAPLFDHQGRVVAVGAGGLKSGATGLVWAVNASYLLNPGNWNAVSGVQGVPVESNLAFAVQPPQQALQTVSCGTFSLTKSRTSSFYDIAATVDDPAGLQQVAQAVGFGLPIDFNNMRFDVWEDLNSGAVIPLPPGATPVVTGGDCRANVGSGVTI